MKKLLVSFSGGETSAYMAQWLWNHKRNEHEMVFVFANTGEENEETLDFIEKCSNHFGFSVVWVEAVFTYGDGTKHKVVDYKTATRSKKLFEEMTKDFGISNQAYPHCNRELKLAPIQSYIRSIGWKDYETAIGIRYDESDRMAKSRKENKLIYPLITMIPMTKPKINFWWSQQPFRLNLKEWQGNCKTCWKKSDKKLFKIAQENPEHFKSFAQIEDRYKDYIPPHRNRAAIVDPIYFFRKNRSANDIIEQSKRFNGKLHDNSQNINTQMEMFDLVGGESCEIFSNCGDN